jgi:hypothetical protein
LPNEREQREYASLTVIVGPHHEDDVFDADHERERPDDERQDAKNVGRRRLQAILVSKAGLERVQRARADVTEHDAERRHGGRAGGATLVVLLGKEQSIALVRGS